MKNWLLGLVLAVCLIPLIGSKAQAASTLDIEALDRVFTSDTLAFRKQVAELESHSQQFSLEDQLHLRYYAALAAMLQSDYRLAQANLQQVLADSAEQRLRYRSLVSLINVYQLTGNFYQAFVHGLQLSEEPVDSVPLADQARGTLVMALVLMDSGLYEEASELIREKQLLQTEPRFRCAALYLISQIAYKSQIFVRSLSEIGAERDWCKQQDQRLYAYLTETSLAILQLEQQRPDEALRILLPQRDHVKHFGYENLSVFWQAVLVRALAQHGGAELHDEMLRLEQLVQTPVVQQSLEGAMLAYQALMMAYKTLDDPKKSLVYSELYIRDYQRHHNRQLTAALAYHAALMQAAQRKKEIEALNLTTGRLQLEAALSKAEAQNHQLYLALSAVVVLVLSVVLYWIYRAKARLRERVTYDKLTRVYSRDHFEDLLDQALEQAAIAQQEVGFILFDLDHFKLINDNYGHPVGDWVLQQMAATVRGCLRGSDAFGRIGGEEFAIMLRDCDLEHTLALAETVRQAIETIDSTPSGKQFVVTASFGVAMASGAQYHARLLVANADDLLYQAKRAGRNRVRPALDYVLPDDELAVR